MNMSVKPPKHPYGYRVSEVIEVARKFGYGAETVLLSLAEGILISSVYDCFHHPHDIPALLWNISLEDFIDMRGDDGEFYVRQFEHSLHEQAASDIYCITESASQKSAIGITDYARDILGSYFNIDIDDFDDSTSDVTWSDLEVTALDIQERLFDHFCGESSDNCVWVSLTAMGRFAKRIEMIEVPLKFNKYAKKNDYGGRNDHSQWSDIYINLITTLVARDEKGRSLLDMAEADSLSHLAGIVHKPDPDPRLNLKRETVADKLGEISKRAEMKRERARKAFTGARQAEKSEG